MLRAFYLFIFLGLFSSTSWAQTSITIGQGIYAPYGQGTALGSASVYQSAEIRVGALTSAVGAWRATHGSLSWPIGTRVTVTYTDGTSERFIVTGTVTSKQAAPIAGTQKDKDGNLVSSCDVDCSPAATGSGGADGGGPSGGSSGSSWWSTFLNWMLGGDTRTGKVDIGRIQPV